MTAVRINSYLTFNYSYDLSVDDTRNVSNGNHEIILGIMHLTRMRKAALW